jgi:DUF2934 family protein
MVFRRSPPTFQNEERNFMASRALKIDPQKAAASNPNINSGRPEVDQAAISARAYELWQERGRPIGSDQEDWFRAEQELRASTRSAA